MLRLKSINSDISILLPNSMKNQEIFKISLWLVFPGSSCSSLDPTEISGIFITVLMLMNTTCLPATGHHTGIEIEKAES